MTFDTGDPFNGYAGFTVLAPGETLGLANVSYSVSADATLGTSDTISFVLSNDATSLSDDNGNAVVAATQNGLISVRRRGSRAVIIDAGDDRRTDGPGRDAGFAGPIASTRWLCRRLNNRWAGIWRFRGEPIPDSAPFAPSTAMVPLALKSLLVVARKIARQRAP